MTRLILLRRKVRASLRRLLPYVLAATKGEVVLVSRLRAALESLNPALPPEAITAAVDESTRGPMLPRLLSGQVALASGERARK